MFAKALAKDPAERYGSCAEFVAALRAALEAAGAARPGRSAPSPRRPPRRARARGPRGSCPSSRLLLLAGDRRGGAAVALLRRRLAEGRAAAAAGERLREDGDAAAARPSSRPRRPTTTAPTTTAPAAGGDPYALNNQAWALMKQGDYASALPLLESAVQQLQGRTDLGTAYANYNLGVTLIALGRCSEAMPYLETSRAIQPSRHEVKDALKQAHHCSG